MARRREWSIWEIVGLVLLVGIVSWFLPWFITLALLLAVAVGLLVWWANARKGEQDCA